METFLSQTHFFGRVSDITVYTTKDKVKHYIYKIIDNFSRKVIGWCIADKVSAKIRVKTIKEAVKKVFGEDALNDLRLITDGGPENDNGIMKAFIKNANVNIEHQIALRDIVFSNSMIEATYRVLKYSYLYDMEIANGKELNSALKFYFDDYDNRPHYIHKYYSPNEVFYNNTPPINTKELYKQAAENRINTNKQRTCNNC